MKKYFTSALAASVATVTLATMLATSQASAALAFTNLTLLNGWKTYSADVRAPKVAIDADGVVHFVGAISDGTTSHAFTLAAQFRPAEVIFVVVDMCGAAPGRIQISPDGRVFAQADDAFSDAQCFTSLDGAQFAK
jgi:hypothetical protein